MHIVSNCVCQTGGAEVHEPGSGLGAGRGEQGDLLDAVPGGAGRGWPAGLQCGVPQPRPTLQRLPLAVQHHEHRL